MSMARSLTRGVARALFLTKDLRLK